MIRVRQTFGGSFHCLVERMNMMKRSSEKNGIKLAFLKNGPDREARVHPQLLRAATESPSLSIATTASPSEDRLAANSPEPQPISRIRLALLGRDRWTKSFVNLVSNRIVLTELAGCASPLKSICQPPIRDFVKTKSPSDLVTKTHEDVMGQKKKKKKKAP